jgi:hypothetical protein
MNKLTFDSNSYYLTLQIILTLQIVNFLQDR